MTTAIHTNRNTVIKGDCTQVLPQLPASSVDFILTDPPYICRFKDRSGRTIRNDDNAAWIRPAFAEMHRVLAPDRFCVSFYGWTALNHYIPAIYEAGFRIIGNLTFAKNYASKTGFLHYRHESAFLLAKGWPAKPGKTINDVLPWKYSENKHHPSEKHVSTLRPLIETFSAAGSLVLDPFSGSGSTLLAAKALGRSYLGIELDPKYHAIASSRLEASA